MKILSVVLQVLGAISGVGVLIVGIRWLYFRFSAKKIYYAHKVFPIAKEKYFHLLSFWNPTYQVITENDITESIKVKLGMNEGYFHILDYTDKCLTEKFKIEKYCLQVNFSSFPSKAGILISYVSDRPDTYIEGEIKNQSLQEVDYTIKKYSMVTPLAMLILILFLNKISQIDTCLFGLILCVYLILSLTIYLIERYFYYPKMPKVLWESFQGKKYWY